ncbi:DUF3987 domain-containing protein, partial [Nocardiopsis salina]|uniref:DUF3987 domain-containing protein n=1 Tax=Nocardiopsis salina TaxID=245836 RepID=UPI0012695D69
LPRPIRSGSKHPGSVVGGSWHLKSSRDPQQLTDWFLTDGHTSMALHVGPGAVVFDVDDPDQMPEPLAEAITKLNPPYQSTRTGQPMRGHYVFATPHGQGYGNSTGALGGAWGEVRGENGVIVVAPSEHEKAEQGGRYKWLTAGALPVLPETLAEKLTQARESRSKATREEVEEFLDTYTAQMRPYLLNAIVERFAARANGGYSRHDSVKFALLDTMTEARVGMYAARRAEEALRPLHAEMMAKPRTRSDRALTPKEAGAEFDDVLAWVVSAVKAKTGAELNGAIRGLTERVPETHDPLGNAAQKAQKSGQGSSEASSVLSVPPNEGGHLFEGAPVPVHVPRLPAFPTGHLGTLAEWVRAASVSLNVSEDIAAFSALSVISAAVGGRRRVKVKDGWTEMVCLYAMALADSSARKTPALSLAMEPLERAAAELAEKVGPEVWRHNEQVEIAEARYEKAKQQAKSGKADDADLQMARDEVEEAGTRRHLPQILAGGDSTIEYLAKTMGEQGGRVAVLGSEATLWKHAAGIYGNGQANIGPLLEGYTGVAYHSGRVSRGGSYMPHTAVTLGLIIQTGMVEGLSKQNPDFKESGFLNRFLMALSPQMPPGTFDAPGIPPAVVAGLESRVSAIVHQVWAGETVATLELTDQARRRFGSFYNDVEQRKGEGGDLHDLAEWAGKLCGQIARVAACMEIYDNPGAVEITEGTMARAIELAPYFIAHARRVFELMDARAEGGRRPLAEILDWLAKNARPGEQVSVRKVHVGLHGRQWVPDVGGAAVVRDAMVELEDLGWLADVTPERTPGKKGRPPSPRYALHPDVHADGPAGNAAQKAQKSGQGSSEVSSVLSVPPNEGGHAPEPTVSTCRTPGCERRVALDMWPDGHCFDHQTAA